MTLKGVYDLHREGLLHRDLKPDNMNIMSREQPIVVLFDLGMARMYTDAEGKVSFHNLFFDEYITHDFSVVPIEVQLAFVVLWNGQVVMVSFTILYIFNDYTLAIKGREQTRYDDLIAWLYCMIDLIHGNKDSNQVFPWSSRPKGGKVSS